MAKQPVKLPTIPNLFQLSEAGRALNPPVINVPPPLALEIERARYPKGAPPRTFHGIPGTTMTPLGRPIFSPFYDRPDIQERIERELERKALEGDGENYLGLNQINYFEEDDRQSYIMSGDEQEELDEVLTEAFKAETEYGRLGAMAEGYGAMLAPMAAGIQVPKAKNQKIAQRLNLGLGKYGIVFNVDGTSIEASSRNKTLKVDASELGKLKEFIIKEAVTPEVGNEITKANEIERNYAKESGFNTDEAKRVKSERDAARGIIKYINDNENNERALVVLEKKYNKGRFAILQDAKKKLEAISPAADVYDTEYFMEVDKRLQAQNDKDKAEAIKLNKDAENRMSGIATRFKNKYGKDLTAENIEEIKPTSQKEYDELLEFINDIRIVEQKKKMAADKYEDANMYYDQKTFKAIGKETVGLLRGLFNSVKNKGNEARGAKAYNLGKLGVITEEEASRRMAYYASKPQLPVSKMQLMLMKKMEEEGTGDFLGYLGDPAVLLPAMATLSADALTQMIVMTGGEMLSVQAASGIIGAGVGLAIGRTPAAAAAGFRTGMSVGGTINAYAGNVVSNVALEVGLNAYGAITAKYTPEEILAGKWVNDPEIEEKAMEGLKKGGAIALTEFALQAMFDKFRISSIASTANRVSRTIARNAVFETAQEGAGEAIGQLAAYGELNGNEVVAEMLGAGGMVASNPFGFYREVYKQVRNNYYEDLADNMSKSREFINGTGDNISRVQEWAGNMRKMGKITEETERKIVENVADIRQARIALSALDDTDAQRTKTIERGTKSKIEDRLADLYAAKRKLDRTPQLNKPLQQSIQNEIDYIVLNKKPAKELSVNLSPIIGTGPVYKVDGEYVGKRYIDKIIDAMPPSVLSKMNIQIENDDDTSNKLAGKIEEDVSFNVAEYDDDKITFVAESKEGLPRRFREMATRNESTGKYEVEVDKSEMAKPTEDVSDADYEAFKQGQVSEGVLESIADSISEGRRPTARQREIYSANRDAINAKVGSDYVAVDPSSTYQQAAQEVAKGKAVYAKSKKTGKVYSVSNKVALDTAYKSGARILMSKPMRKVAGEFKKGKFQKTTTETTVRTWKSGREKQAFKDFATRLAGRIGANVVFEEDEGNLYKGYYDTETHTAVINLAYADSETLWHEIFGHPIIAVIKNDPKYAELYNNLVEEINNTELGREIYQNVQDTYKFNNPEDTMEEAIVKLLGMMSDEAFKKKENANLLSRLKELLKEMADWVRAALRKDGITIDDFPANATIGDIARLLGYTNKKIVLPGYEIEYLTPTGLLTNNYAEVQKEIYEIANGSIAEYLSFSKKIADAEAKMLKYPYTSDEYKLAKKEFRDLVKRAFSENDEAFGADNKGSYYRIVNPFTHEVDFEIKHIYDAVFYIKNLTGDYNLDLGLASMETKQIPFSKLFALLDSSKRIRAYMEANKIFAFSKMVVENWIRENNIVYNPQEAYSRGFGFQHSIGLYSNAETISLLQNIMQLIEDNEAVGGEYILSAATINMNSPVPIPYDNRLRITIYPQSGDIKWAADEDVFSGTTSQSYTINPGLDEMVKDAKTDWERRGLESQAKALAGVTKTKYPSPDRLSSLRSSIAQSIASREYPKAVSHNEFAIALKGNNWRIEYEDSVDERVQETADKINKILDEKYGPVNKPEYNKVKPFEGDTIMDANGEFLKVEPLGSPDQAFYVVRPNGGKSAFIEEAAGRRFIYRYNTVPLFESPTVPAKNFAKDLDDYDLDNPEVVASIKREVDKEIENKEAKIAADISAIRKMARKYPRVMISSRVVPSNSFERTQFSGKGKKFQAPALSSVEATAKALEGVFNPEFKNTIIDKLSKFDKQIKDKKFPSALEVAEHVLPRSIFNKYKNLYELAARNNITVSNERLPFNMVATWAFGNIQINKDVLKYYLGDFNEFAETLNHEIIHGLLSRGIRNNYALFADLQDVMGQIVSKFDSASDEVKDIISYIQDTRNEFIEKDILGATKQELDSDKYREVGSLEELITYAFTNKEFANFLDSIPASKDVEIKGDSIFQQLKNIIRDFISKITKSPTALDEINSVLDKYFDTNWNESDIAERNKTYEWNLRFSANENIFDKYNNDSNNISEAYHKAKADGSNPELVRAVEELLVGKPKFQAPALSSVEATNKALEGVAERGDLPAIFTEQEIDISDIQEENADGQKLSDAIVNVKDGLGSKTEGKILIYESGGKYYIADGFHRVAEAKINGNKSIKADVVYVKPKAISEAYHKAKADGSNPELVRAVEELLGGKPKFQAPALSSVEATTKALEGVDSNEPSKRSAIINDKPQEVYALSMGINPDDLSYLGRGDFGVAYSTKDGRVVKITSSANEAEIAKNLIGKKGNHAEIYDVKKIGNRFVIYQEELNTDSEIEENLQSVEGILSEQGLPIQYLGNIDYDKLSQESKDEYDRLSDFISDLENINRLYRNLGIEASDLQSGNLGYDETGKLKAFDLQDKSSKIKIEDVDVDLLKSKNEVISEAYHKAKADGSNPELVNAVEELLGGRPQSSVKEVPSSNRDWAANSAPSNVVELSKFLNHAFPGVEVFMDAEEFNRMRESGELDMVGEVYGMTKDGKIYINPEVHDSESEMFNTLIHEFGHVWLNYIKVHNNALYTRGVELVKETKEYKAELAKGKSPDQAADEALAIIIGNRGAEVVDSKLKNWLKDIWKYITKYLGPIETMTLDDFINTALSDLLSGKPIPQSSEAFEATLIPEPQFRNMEDRDIADIVIEARDRGYTDEAIRRYLQINKYDKQDIEIFMNGLGNVITGIRDPELMPFPTAFANVTGGYHAGLALWNNIRTIGIDLYRNRKKRKAVKGQRGLGDSIVDAMMEALKADPAYINASVDLRKQLMVALLKSSDIRMSRNMRAYLRRLTAEAKNIARGVKMGGAVKDKLVTYIIASLPKSKYTKPEVKALLERVKGATAENMQQIIEEVQETIAKIKNKDLKASVAKLLNTDITKKKKGVVTGVTTIEAQNLLTALNGGMLMTEDSAPAEIEAKIAEQSMALNEMLNEVSALPYGDQPDAYRIIEALMIAVKYNASLLMDDGNDSKTDVLKEINDELKRIVKGEKAKFLEEKLEGVKRRKELVAIMASEILSVDPDAVIEIINDKEKLEEKKQELSDRTEAREQRFAQRFIDTIVGFFSGTTEDFTSIINKVAISATSIFEGVAYDLIVRRISDAQQEYDRLSMLTTKMMEDAAKNIFGPKWERALLKNAKKNITIPGFKSKFSVNQLYYIYNQYKDESNQASVLASFKNAAKEAGVDPVDILNYIVDYLTFYHPDVVEWADWQVNEYFPAVYDLYSPVYEKVFNTPMPWERNYAGKLVRAEASTTPEVSTLFKEIKLLSPTVAGSSTKARKDVVKAIAFVDGDSILKSYTREMNFFASFEEAIRDVAGIFNNQLVKNAIEATSGKKVYKDLVSMIEAIQRLGYVEERSMLLSGAKQFALAKLAGNIRVFLSQLTTFMGYIPFIGINNFGMYAGKILGDPFKIMAMVDEMKESNASLKLRLEGVQLNTLLGALGKTEEKFWIPQKWVEHMMTLARLGDKYGILGGIPVYAYYKDKYIKQGMDPESAKRLAAEKFMTITSSVAQSNNAQNKGLSQTASDGMFAPLVKSFTLFASQPLQYLRIEIMSIRNMYRILLKTGPGGVANKEFVKNLRAFIAFHFVLPLLYNYMFLLGMPGILNDWDDEDERDLMLTGLLGNLTAIFLLGDVIEGFKDYMTKKPWASEMRNAPIYMAFSDIIQAFRAYDSAKSDSKRQAAMMKVAASLADLSGLPATTALKYISAIDEMIEGKSKFGKKIYELFNLEEDDGTIEGTPPPPDMVDEPLKGTPPPPDM